MIYSIYFTSSREKASTFIKKLFIVSDCPRVLILNLITIVIEGCLRNKLLTAIYGKDSPLKWNKTYISSKIIRRQKRKQPGIDKPIILFYFILKYCLLRKVRTN